MKRGTPYAPTILNSDDVFLDNCPKCGRTRYNHCNDKIVLLVEGKRTLPDFLLCGHYPLTIISDKTLKAWKNAQITGYTSSSVRIFNKQKEEISQPQYHYITITGRAELDFEKMGVEIINICDVCGVVDYNKQTWEFGLAVIKENTYDNSDLFTFEYFDASVSCSIRVLETVYRNKLTNFRFKDLESKFMFMTPTQCIDLKSLFGQTRVDTGTVHPS